MCMYGHVYTHINTYIHTYTLSYTTTAHAAHNTMGKRASASTCMRSRSQINACIHFSFRRQTYARTCVRILQRTVHTWFAHTMEHFLNFERICIADKAVDADRMHTQTSTCLQATRHTRPCLQSRLHTQCTETRKRI